MDALVTSLIGAAPQLGVAGVLLVLLGLVLRWSAQERTTAREDAAAAAARHQAELARLNSDHDAELGELRDEIKALREQIDQLNIRLDAERDRRRQAEDSIGRHAQRREGPTW